MKDRELIKTAIEKRANERRTAFIKSLKDFLKQTLPYTQSYGEVSINHPFSAPLGQFLKDIDPMLTKHFEGQESDKVNDILAELSRLIEEGR